MACEMGSLVSFLGEVTIWIWSGSEGSVSTTCVGKYDGIIVLGGCLYQVRWYGLIVGIVCVWESEHGLDGRQYEDETKPIFCRQAITMYIYMDVSGHVVWEIGGSWMIIQAQRVYVFVSPDSSLPSCTGRRRAVAVWFKLA